jgi:hypothetical protein
LTDEQSREVGCKKGDKDERDDQAQGHEQYWAIPKFMAEITIRKGTNDCANTNSIAKPVLP